MRVLLVLLVLMLMAAPVSATDLRPGVRITSATTTQIVAAVAGQTIAVLSGSICVDADGVATNITLQSSTPTNLIGTSVVYHLAAGTCLIFPYRGNQPYGSIAVAGTALQVVTSAAGPVNVYLEVQQR